MAYRSFYMEDHSLIIYDELLHYDENFNSDSRTGNINVTSAQLPSKLVTLYQEKCSIMADVSPNSFSESGGNATINIVSNSNWTIAENEDWITVGSSSGNGTVNLNVSVLPHTGNEQRTGIVTVSGCDKTINLMIIQDAPCILSVSPISVNFTKSSGSNNSVVINSNGV